MDHLTYNRQGVAAAYRRLSDSALIAAEVFSHLDAVTDETDAQRVVQGRIDSVRHALAILDATRRGIAKAAAGHAA
jgi:hydrogenase maturation factor